MSEPQWKPTACIANLKARAALYQRLRAFFAAREVLEVEVPLLSHAAVSDPQLSVISAPACGQPAYLQTSPEFGLKRLLSAGIGACYSLGKAFRDDEAGGRHNPEFTMLEWYRPGFDDHQLMREVDALLRSVAELRTVATAPRRLPEAMFRSYREVFQQCLGVDPHTATAGQLEMAAQQHLQTDLTSFVGEPNRDVWLDLLMTHCIEPSLKGVQFIYDYPQSQSALARCNTDEQGAVVARRFELYVDGVELANGYWELTDADELSKRFQADQAYRAANGLPCRPLDERLLAAHRAGLPDCAGVAMGVDRLLMWLTGSQHIEQVIALPFPRA